MNERFRKFAGIVATAGGSAGAFFLAALAVVLWAVSGPIFGYSDHWQLIINTSTTIVTFLIVFLIQSTQNRDARAIHLKLDELIRAVHGARDRLVDLENLTDDELDHLQKEFQRLRRHARTRKAPTAGAPSAARRSNPRAWRRFPRPRRACAAGPTSKRAPPATPPRRPAPRARRLGGRAGIEERLG